MRAFALIYISVLLIVVDRSTTWIALEANLGTESNPHVNTESYLSLFLSPVPLTLSIFFLLYVLLIEACADKVYTLLSKGHPLAPMCLLPLIFIWMMSFICISNLIGALGFGTPLARFASIFSFITKDRHELVGIAMAVINLAGLPLLTNIGLRIYTPRNPQPTPIATAKPEHTT